MTPEFLHCFRSLLAALGERPGWYAEYARRDPDAARAHETGHEVPPWDVVRTILRDLARNAGASDAGPADVGRVHTLHAAAVAAEDARPGAGARLYARLAAAERAHEAAAARARDAARAHARQPSTSRAGFLAWTRDDLERAVARRTALHARLGAVLPATEPPGGTDADAAPAPRPRGARFAGAPAHGDTDERPVSVPREAARSAGEPARAPRGARFAGAAAG
ncbi:hypothetical protein ACWERV_25685, partial [Streptomyces sp. NPDC004031]